MHAKPFLAFFFLCLISSAFSVSPEELVPQGYVSDYAYALSLEEKEAIENVLIAFENETTVEMAVVFIDSTGNMPIEQFAFDLGSQWKIGKKDTFNGILAVIAVDDHEYFIATAKGIEGALPDLAVHRIAEANFPEKFKIGDYAKGILGAIKDIYNFTKNDQEIVSKYSGDEEETPLWLIIAVVFLF